MYHLLNFQNKFLGLPFKRKVNVDKCLILSYPASCQSCRLLQKYTKVSNRHHSTLQKPKEYPKIRKRTTKKYTELLIVSDNSTMESKALIKTFRAKDIEKLLKINYELNQFNSFKKFSENTSFFEDHTYDNLSVMSGVYSSDSPPINFDIPLIKTPLIDENQNFKIKNWYDTEDPIDENELFQSVPANSFQPERLDEIIDEDLSESTEINVKPNETETNINAKQEIIHRTLGSYIEVCCQQELYNRAYKALVFFRNSPNRSKHGARVTDIKVYNALLRGLAKKGYSQRFIDIVNLLKSENVEPNLQTYAHIFECLGRSPESKNVLRHIKIFAEEALSKGFTFGRILNDCSFLKDERRYALKSMKIHDPNFEQTFPPPILQYNNELVNGLNHQEQLKFPSCKYEESRSNFSKEKLKSLIDKQMELEDRLYITIKSVELKDPPNEEIMKHRVLLNKMYAEWEDAAFKGFRRDLASLTAKKGTMNDDIFLQSIPAKDFVTIILDEAKKMAQGSETYSPTVNMLYRHLGDQVYNRFKVMQKKRLNVIDKASAIHKEYCDMYAASHKKLSVLPTEIDYFNSRQKWQWIEHKHKEWGSTLNMNQREWVPTALINIGKFLYNIIMHDLKINVHSMKPTKTPKHMPAFFTIFRNQGRIIKEEVKPHPFLSKLYRTSCPETLTFPVWDVPMVCPPIPWTSVHNGGYLLSTIEVVRLPIHATSQRKMLEECNPQQLYPVLDSLNQLAAVPWKVNKKLLDVILEVFNSGGSSKLDVPEPPSSLPPPVASPNMDKQEKYNFFKQKLQHKRKRGEMYSLWCDCLYRLSLANHFRDEIFWLPHNMDFRGRVYPIPPHLNHLGSDLARSMLVFGESRPLGKEGLDWLKIHLINLTGLKKRDCLSDRLQFANESMDLILDSADRPLTGRKWWAESEEPWQTLACCMEIADATRSPDPTKYESHFPIHQDGSCNGLQHYAALGRDKAGGYSVNLCPAEVPQDVYSAVVNLVEERRKQDAENGLPVAKHLEGFVKRKVIKQTIMTTVYGVTRYGAKLQIIKQLKDIDDFPKELVWSASSYLTAKTFESLRTMFTSTKEIQDWFTECARLISAVGGRHVDWITPMGLPVVQPYFRFRKMAPNSIAEPFQMDNFEKPNVMKQKNAFPPNFIHSLDSSHMMLTSLHTERAGITFVSVHDCYWTHASTVHIMNKICREQFVALHSQPILEDLSLYLSENYSYSEGELANDGSVADLTKKKLNRVLGRLPATGDLDINKVLKSVYFFS